MTTTLRTTFLFLLGICLLSGFGTTAAAAPPSFDLTIREHSFEPRTLTIPADTRIKLQVMNSRRLPSEFESFVLNREKVVPGGTTVNVWIGPLRPGKYKFFDDFNPGVTGYLNVPSTQTANGGAR